MGAAGTYLTAVVAGAMTAGIGAANVVAVPEPADSARPGAEDVGLAAAITIPIIDIDPTVGPLTIIRRLAVTLGTTPDQIFGRLNSESGTIYDLPGLLTDFSSKGIQELSATRTPGGIRFGFDSEGPEHNEWSLLDFANGLTDIQRSRSLNFTALTGGAEGIGAALGGTLADATVERSVSVLDSGFTVGSNRKVGDFDGQLSFVPFDGFKAVGGGTLIDTDGQAGFKLGSLELGAGGDGVLGGDAGLCLGSAAATCGGRTAFASLNVPVGFEVNTGDSMTNVFSVDLPNNLAVAVQDRHLSVTGDIGGTVKIGSVELGRVIPIDIQIPRASSMMSVSSDRQAQSVRDSFRATPRKLSSDNETGGRHRAPLREAIADVKTAVDKAVHGRHAAKESAD